MFERRAVAIDRLVRPRPAQSRLAKRGSGNRERVDRVGLTACAAGAPLRDGQLWRHAHQLLADTEELPLEPAGQLSAVLDRPEALAVEGGGQPSSSPLPTEITFSSSGLRASSTATAVTDRLCTSSPITIMVIASKPLGATGERTDLNRGQWPRSYQVTLDGLGRRRRHNAEGQTFGSTCGIVSAVAPRVSSSNRTPPPRRR
jgi:hypothetical protein